MFVLVTGVHPLPILSAVFCVSCILLMCVSDASGDHGSNIWVLSCFPSCC